MSYGQYSGLSLTMRENIAVTDEIRDYMQGVEDAAKKQELEMLKKRVEQLESELQ